MKKFLLNRAATVLMASLVVVGALIAQPVFALLTGTATSTTNQVTATGADIAIDDDTAGGFSAAASGSLAATFTAEEIRYAGFIDVQNPAGGTPNWDLGYDLLNVATVTAGTANARLNTALKVTINAFTTATTCAGGAAKGAAVLVGVITTEGGNVITDATWTGTASPGTTLFSDRMALSDTSVSAKVERLCFYLTLPAGTDTGDPSTSPASGTVTYALNFTAN